MKCNLITEINESDFLGASDHRQLFLLAASFARKFHLLLSRIILLLRNPAVRFELMREARENCGVYLLPYCFLVALINIRGAVLLSGIKRHRRASKLRR